jgi:DNA-binding transcriptional regulator YiaG
MRKCSECGAPLRLTRGAIPYDLGGLPALTLEGVELWRCEACEEPTVGIPQTGPLHRLIAEALVTKPAPLAPEEIRFLRTWMGWEGVEFAARLGVSPETISRWEHGAHPTRPLADRSVRLLAAVGGRLGRFDPDRLAAIDAKARPAPLRLRLRFDGERWHRLTP